MIDDMIGVKLLNSNEICIYEMILVYTSFYDAMEHVSKVLDIYFLDYYGYEISISNVDLTIKLRSNDVVKIRTMLINNILE